MAEFVDPSSQDFVIGRFEVEEFNAHSHARFYDPDDDQGIECLALTDEFHTRARINRKRFAGADEAAPEGDIGGDPIDLLAGLKVDKFRIGSERVADGIATVTNTWHTKRRVFSSIGHGDDFAHKGLLERREQWAYPRR